MIELDSIHFIVYAEFDYLDLTVNMEEAGVGVHTCLLLIHF